MFGNSTLCRLVCDNACDVCGEGSSQYIARKGECDACSAVAGGAVVLLLALAAAPMVCRKKED